MVKKLESFLLVCPKCGSTNVSNDLSKDMVSWSGSTRYLCNDCDFSSIAFPELKKSQLQKFRKGLTYRTKGQKQIIEKQESSKGLQNKTVNKIFAYGYILSLLGSSIWAFNWSYSNDNYFLVALSIILFIFCIILLFKKKN